MKKVAPKIESTGIVPVGTRIRLREHGVWSGYEGVVEKVPTKDEPKHLVRLDNGGGRFTAHATFEQMEIL